MMLVRLALKGYAIEASDGQIGTLSNFLFDDRTWKIRWIVVETGSWLAGRKTLIHPSAVRRPDCSREKIVVRLTKQQVKDSPNIVSDTPVCLQMETDLYGHYGWDPLWGGGNYFGGYSSGMGGAFDPSPYRFDSGLLEADRYGSNLDDGDPHLMSVAAIVNYHIQAADGPIGHIEDFLIDDETWDIRYLIIDTRSWWPGQRVLVSPYAVRAISWGGREVTLDVTRDKVKRSPIWDPARLIDRGYEEQLHAHYEWPGYAQ